MTTALLSGLVFALPAAAADEIRERQYWLEEYGISAAWEESTGEGVTVAVIDSGIEADHPDLAGAVVGGTDVSGSGAANGLEGLGQDSDTKAHGTLVATLLAGRGHAPEPEPEADDDERNPSSSPSDYEGPGAGPDGVIGVAPDAEILSISTWLDSTNPSGVDVDQQIPAAVRWAVDNGADIINMSLGSTSQSWPQSWDDAFIYAEQQDVLIVAAAGNRAGGLEQVGAPATMPGVLTVAGVNVDGQASQDSSTQGITIDLAAPAESLVGGLPGGGYAKWSGTSGAAPIVSGVAALIRSKWPELTAEEVAHRIIATARDVVPGVDPDPLYGYGILDAAAALTAKQLPEVGVNPLGISMAEWARTHRRGDVENPGNQGPAPAPAPSESALPPVPDAPMAIEPAATSETLPKTVVLGFAALMALIVVGGTAHVLHLRKLQREKAASATPSDTPTEE